MGDEVLYESIQCFLLAAKVYTQQESPLAAHVLEQLASGLEAATWYHAAARYHYKAAEVSLD